MKKVFAVYKTDNHHSHGSKDLIGTASEWGYAQVLCDEQARKEGESFDGDQQWNLANLKQTQGYRGEGEFVIEEIELNVLI